MDNDIDYYLSRCMKNWAAENQPPLDGRARLLKAASSPPVQRDRQIIRIMTTVWATFFGRDYIYSEAGWVFGPQAYPRDWRLHIDSNWRLAF